MDHVVEVGHLAVGVTDHREVHGLALGLLDVFVPGAVRLDRVDRQADELGVALVELGLGLGESAQLGGAHGGEVLGVGEQDPPRVAQPLVEIDRSLGRVGGEIGGDIP